MSKFTIVKGLVVGGVLTCLTFLSASAQDVTVQPKSGNNDRAPFEGFYIGTVLSAGGLDSYRADTDGYLTDNGAWTITDFAPGIGFQIGRDWQKGSRVFGVVGDFNWMNADKSLYDNLNGGGTLNTIKSTLNWTTTLRGRAGMTNDGMLLYLTGGVALADFDTFIADGPGHNFSYMRLGATGGAGAEFSLSDNWNLGGEFLYTQFAPKRLSFSEGAVTSRFDTSDSAILAKLALSYRFGGPAATNIYDAAAIERGGAFDGFYVGTVLSGGIFDSYRADNDGYLTDNSSWTSTDLAGGAGIQFGHDWQRGNRVLGIVGDFNWLNSDAVTRDNPNSGDVTPNSVKTTLGWMSTLRGRAGVADDNTLIYLSGGVALADIDTVITDGTAYNFSDTRLGMTGGAGAEFALSDNWNLGGEFLYTKFAPDTINFTEAPNSFLFDTADSAVLAKLSLSYRFGERKAAKAPVSKLSNTAFDGYYAGAVVSAGAVEAYRADNDGYLTDNSSWTTTDFTAGGGAQFGRDWQKGRRVLGLVGDVNVLAGRESVMNDPNGFPGTVTSRISWMSTLRGRVGMASNDTMLYLTGGAAVADIDTSITEAAAHNFSETHFGMTGGAGAEFVLSDKWSLGGEVLYTKFAPKKLRFTEGATNYQFDSTDSAVAAKLALNYRF